MKYDQWGRETERIFHDRSGNPTSHREGYARVETRYDYADNVIETLYFDLDGKPMKPKS